MDEDRIAFAGSAPWLLRALSCSLLALSLVWAWAMTSTNLFAAAPRNMAHRLLLDATYPADELKDARDESRRAAGSRAAFASAILSLSLLEATGPKASETVRRDEMSDAERDIVAALRQSPSQGYLWFALYALRMSQPSADAAVCLPLLEMSYRLAPLEGWIGVRRSLEVMPHIDTMPFDVQTAAKLEFHALLNEDVAPVVRNVFWKANTQLRLDILSHIAALSNPKRDRMLRSITRPILTQ